MNQSQAFTRSEFLQLPADDRKIAVQVLDYLGGDAEELLKEKPDEDWDTFRDEYFELLDASTHNGCVPEGYADGDLLKAIRKKYACVFWPVLLGTAERIGGHRGELTLVIDPDYEDHTRVVIFHDKLSLVLLTYSAKAWNFRFANLAALTAEIRQLTEEAVNRYRELVTRYRL